MSMLEHALEYAAAGFPVFPLRPGLKKPFPKTNGVKEATTDEAKIRAWWTKNPEANIGLPMGEPSGLIGLDVDYKDGAALDFLSSIPETVTQKTPNNGHHPFFKYPGKALKNGKVLEKGVTVRSDGYYFVISPSVFENSNYSWLKRSLIDGEIADVPDWIISIPGEKPAKSKAANATIGQRHPTLVSRATFLRKKGKSPEEILENITKLNHQFKDGPKPEDEVREAADWARRVVKPVDPMAEDATNQDKVFPSFPDEDKKGKRLGTMENIVELLRRLQISVRYNVISKKEEFIIPDFEASMDNYENATIAEITSWCARAGIPRTDLKLYLTRIADENQYNPVATWIESIPWDGESRLQDLYDTIRSTDEKLKEILMRRWLISAVAAAYEPHGVSAHGVLVFKGKQYVGKTMWFKRLVPAELGVVADGQFLRPEDKDSVFQVLQHWLNELGELDATFRKSDISQLKAFLTKNKDCLRRPYDPKESNYPRRTVFFGSVNETDFLKDPTGNRRFWTVECLEIDFKHPVDMQQLWAEVRMLYLAGEPWVLSVDEMELLNKHNESFEEIDPVEERIMSSFDWDSLASSQKELSATDVCLEIGILNPTQRDTRAAARALSKLSTHKISHQKKLYKVPARKMGASHFNSYPQSTY